MKHKKNKYPSAYLSLPELEKKCNEVLKQLKQQKLDFTKKKEI
jgi:hypothetical protein